MAAVSAYSPTPSPPCFSLPLFVSSPAAAKAAADPSSSSSTLSSVPERVEKRLRALRRMSETSAQSHRDGDAENGCPRSVIAPPRRRVSESALDKLEALIADSAGDDAFTTPRILHHGRLETPPTPGRRKRPVPVSGADELPHFLPVGIRARAAANAEKATATAPPPTQLPTRRSSAPPSPKRLRTAPRYECPWLASFAAAKLAAAEAVDSKDNAADEKGKASKSVDDKLIGTLQNAADLLEISGGRTATEDEECKSVASDLSGDDEVEEEDSPPRIGHA